VFSGYWVGVLLFTSMEKRYKVLVCRLAIWKYPWWCRVTGG
jgi:hypothetical protein